MSRASQERLDGPEGEDRVALLRQVARLENELKKVTAQRDRLLSYTEGLSVPENRRTGEGHAYPALSFVKTVREYTAEVRKELQQGADK